MINSHQSRCKRFRGGGIGVPLPSLRRRLLRTAPLAAAVLIAALPLPAADAPPVLLVVPPGSDLAKVEAARAAVPPSRALLTIGSTERASLREGVELVLDRTFSDAPPSDLVVVLPGEDAGEEAFLVHLRSTARVILFLGDSPLVKRLKGDGSRDALILVGGTESVRALAGAETGAAPAAVAPSSEKPRAVPTATPRPTAAQQAAPTPPASAVQRYFSPRTPTPTSPPSGPPR